MELEVHCWNGVAPAEVREAIAAHRNALAGTVPDQPAAVVLARPWRSVTRTACGAGDAAVKEYRHGQLRLALTSIGLPSRAGSARQAYERFCRSGLPVAPLLATAEERRGHVCPTSYLLTRWVEGGICLRDLLRATPELLADGATLNPAWADLVRSMVAHLTQMQRRGLFMSDYHAPNLTCVEQSGADGIPRQELVLIDFDDVQTVRITWSRRFLNLYTCRKSLGRDLHDPGRRYLARTYLELLEPEFPFCEEQYELLQEFLHPFVVGRHLRRRVAEFARRERHAFPERP